MTLQDMEDDLVIIKRRNQVELIKYDIEVYNPLRKLMVDKYGEEKIARYEDSLKERSNDQVEPDKTERTNK